MREPNIDDESQPFQGAAYYGSLAERNTPKNLALIGLFKAIDGQSKKGLIASLAHASAQGWDINQVIIQANPNSWATIGAYMASRPNLAYGRMFRFFLDYRDLDIAGQLSQPYPRNDTYVNAIRSPDALPNDPLPGFGVQPLVMSFMRAWGKFLYSPEELGKLIEREDQKASKAKMCSDIMKKLSDMGVDWAAPDDQGNTIYHILVNRLDTTDLVRVLPLISAMGLSVNAANHEGLTPIDCAKLRVNRSKKESYSNDAKSVQAFREVISTMEASALAEHTPQTSARSRSFRL